MNCTVSKLFTKAFKNKLVISTSKQINAFTVGRSCIDNLRTIQKLIETRNSHEEDTHLALVDLQKA